MRKSTHTLKKTFVAGTAALLVAGGGAGVAAACNGHNSSTSATSFKTVEHGGFRGDFHHGFALSSAKSSVVASTVVLYLNLPASTIKSDLQAGQSLAQIATAEGKDPNGLIAAIVAAVKPNLDAAVVNGKLTAAQESTLLTSLTDKVTKAVNFQFSAKHDFDHHK